MRNERGAFNIGIVIGLTVLALAMTAVLGILMPLTDPAVGSEAAGQPLSYTQEQVEGRKIYIREGCFTCHTRMVRDAAADEPYGPMSLPADYFNEAPALLGLDRVGPDLTCIGDRQSDIDALVKHLRNPGSVHEGSTMPSYAFLSDRELRAVASYLTALTCQEA
ncbi:MAG TPA: cbb3-type cytochrome c oxidase subunit II [Actinomycetota bacterium]|nr:cbb3-type cytochrome c oxidase subunit II [Actinomycetota bacterium]